MATIIPDKRDAFFGITSILPPDHKPLPILGSILLVYLLTCIFHMSKTSELPLVNPKKKFEFGNTKRKREFMQNAEQILAKGQKEAPGKPFRTISDSGETLVLPGKYANEIRNNHNLSFTKLIYEEFHGSLPGFEAFAEAANDSHILQSVARKQLTHSLAKVTEPLSQETTLALREIFTNSPEWHDVNLKESIVAVVARLSSRVFLGEQLCCDPRWLRITSQYTVTSVTAAAQLRAFPYYLRPIVHWFLPRCRTTMAMVAEARKLIGPVVQQRRAANQALRARGEKMPKYDDAIEWFDEAAKGEKYDPVCIELAISVAAIHTTSDLTCQVLLDLTRHPELIEPLREEIVSVLREGDWKKTSLYNMKLLDSFIKESQRMKPISNLGFRTAGMRRRALGSIKLSDGFEIPAGSTLAVTNDLMRDSSFHEDPDRFDSYRFLRMRETPGMESQAHLVSTSASHMGFGHGEHSCPGRFFAANEVKILLCHFLLKYEWKLAPGVEARICRDGFSLASDPFAKISLRRRREEIEL
ncbi:hypothetical protein DL769_002403 [Monosporascus sp. CRB-8-3]|nr:hypothetical protein DL769_002403 [Monosporascus sp. CRB-8-3]